MNVLHQVSILAVGLAFAWPSAAQEARNAADADALYASSEADTLFRKGRDLIAKGMVSEACAAFAESDKLEPGLGTKLSLADCYEREGKYMSAWLLFLEVERLARQTKRKDREELAKKRADELAIRIPKLIVMLEDPKAVNVDLALDGLAVGASMYGQPVPLDPGKHVLTARAPGFHDWSGDILVSEGSVITVTIPILVAKPPAPPPPPPPPPSSVPPPLPAKPFPWGAVAAWSAGAVGFVAAALARGMRPECEPGTCSEKDPTYVDGKREITNGVAWSGLGVGVAGVLTGVTIWGISDHSTTSRPEKRVVSGVFIDAGPLGASFSVKGVF